MNKYLTLLIALFAALQINAYDTIINNLKYDWGEWSYKGSSDWAAITLVGYRDSYNLPEDLVIPSSVKWDSYYNGTYGRMCRVSRVNDGSFRNCSKLKSVKLPYVIHISTCAFENCNNLKKLVLSDAINYIGSSAFAGCTSLTQICIERTEPPSDVKSDAFDSATYQDATLYVPRGFVNVYKRSSFWNKFVNITDETPKDTYNLSISASGYGSVTYSGSSIRNNTKTYSLNEGTSATISFSPDNGYRVKSVKVNNTDVTSSVSNKSYTISSINADTNIEVEFEAIPPTTYTLTLKATGNGSASYSGTTVRNNTQKFTLNEGISATISFNPDNGYQIKSATMNGREIADLSTMSFTIDYMDEDVSIEVEFEAIPVNLYTLMYMVDDELYKSFQIEEGAKITPEPEPTKEGYTFSGWSEIPTIMPAHDVRVTGTFTKNEPETKTYVLSITATGNGSVSYNNTATRNSTKTFTLNEGISAIITFNPDEGYRIKRATMNGREIADLSSMSFTIDIMDEDVSIEVEFEAIPISTYTLILKSIGNGSVSYRGTTVRNNTKSFSVNEGTSATIMFSPDEGYRIKHATKNGKKIADLSSMSFTIDVMNEDVNIEVEFEAIPQTTYTLSITASGVGSATYNNTVVRGKTTSFTVNEGTNATISFTPDLGYRIKSVKVNSTEVTSSVSNGQYTIRNIKANTTVEVIFEAIPQTTYTLSITASGIGSATYNNTVVRGKTTSFTVNEGTNATISFTPDLGYRIKSVKVNSTDVTSSVSNGQYTIRNIKVNTTVEVIFEAIPTTYTLSITASGNGTASYSGTTVRNDTKSFTLTEGVSATITFSPDKDCRIKSATMNGREIADLSTMSFTIDFMDEDVSIEVEFEAIPFYTLTYVVDGEIYKTYQVQEGAIITPEAEPTKDGYTFSGWSEIPKTMPAYDVTITGTFTKNKPDINSLDKEFTIDGINYEMISTDNQTVVVVAGEYGNVLEVPANIMYGEYNWDVIGLKDDALDKCEQLAAVIWNPSAMFNIRVKNPNLLLYVQDQTYASFGVKNVIVNGTAESIELTDAVNGNDFYCPRAFTARKISYSHHYNMETGLGESKGWETIVLPFDVQNYTHATKGEIEPFTTWTMGTNKKPFWLFELTADGYKDVPGIKANTPYIISMPNNRQYELQYQIPGVVTFSSTNVEVKESDEMKSVSYQGRTFVPNYTNQKNLDYLPLNVNNNYVTYEGADAGSKFIGGLRSVHPFEAYMITTDGTRSIDVMDGMTTAIRDICMKEERSKTMKVYDTKGILIKTVSDNEDLRKGLSSGLYIVNGKKMIIK